VVAGPGDDCAVLQPRKGTRLVATTDALVEGVHFDLSVSRAEDAGHKALAANLSDLAAAGARPRWFLCALGVPRVPRSLWPVLLGTARALGSGMARLARAQRIALVGGNVTSASGWSITITALGEARTPLSRRGAKPGDVLVLAGAVGSAALGLRLLRGDPAVRDAGGEAENLATGAARAAIGAQLRPRPLVAAGLAAAPFAAAAIDVSDGLLKDLSHLLRASRCGAEVDCARLLRSPLVRKAEAALARAGKHRYALSLAGGEDYALLFAVGEARLRGLLAALRKTGVAARAIGRCLAGRGVTLRDGKHELPLPERTGWDHLDL
jgi:thiamine-monophosphate kinase